MPRTRRQQQARVVTGSAAKLENFGPPDVACQSQEGTLLPTPNHPP